MSPQRLPEYLGASLDIPRLLVRPLDRRFVTLQSLIQELVSGESVPALLWEKFLGLLSSLVDLVPNCRLLMRPLPLHFLPYFDQFSDPPSVLVPLPLCVMSLVQG